MSAATSSAKRSAKPGVRVEAGADRGAALRQLAEPRQGCLTRAMP